MKFNIFVFSLILFTTPAAVFPQHGTLRFEHISVEQGLSQSVVNCTIQDKNGYLWFGTSDGLNRYDGYNITIFKHKAGDPYSLSSNDIRCMFLDSRKDLWIGMYKGGLNKYDYKTGTFICFNNGKNASNSLPNLKVNSICEDKSGNLWIATEAGLSEYNYKKKFFRNYFHDPKNDNSLIYNFVRHVYADRDGLLWVATAAGLNTYDPVSGRFTRSFADVISSYQDSQGIMWFSTLANGIIRYDKKTNKYLCLKHNPADKNSLSDNNVRFIQEDMRGNLWIGTINGLNKLQRKTNSFARYFFDPADPNGLNCNELYSVYKDYEGTLWLGTFGGGINKLDLRQEAFVNYRHGAEGSGTLNDNYISSFCEDKQGNLWVGTNLGGLNKLDRKTNKFKYYTYDPNNKNSLASSTILCLLCDNSGDIWAGSFFGGLTRFNPRTNTFTRFATDRNGNPHCLSSDIVSTIIEGSANTLWIGGREGLDKYDKSKNIFTHFRHNPSIANTISDDKINALLLDKSSILWIGTANGGLNCLDLQTGKFKCFKNDPASQTSLSSNNVIAIHQDKFHEEILWIGTDLGFNKFDKTNGTCTHYTEEDGLSNNSINGLLTDNHGNLWVNTNNGITKYNPVTGKFTIYSVKEGLQGNEFNGKASYKDNNGYLYFGGMNGFSVFHPDSIRENFFKPPVVVTSFKILNKEARLSGQVSELNEINLTYKDYVISFEFAGLSFIRPEKNQYAYKLEGFDKNWIFSDAARRFATYTNLEPGEYTLRIKSSNNEGVWNEPGKNIKIIVAPPYWRTWWFKLLVLICFVAAVSFAVWYTQTRKLRKKIEKLQQRHAIEKERARISRNMHDELGGSLTKIHLLSRIITDEKLYTKEKAEKIYRFSNEVIQKLDEIVWTVNAKNDNLKNLVAYICEYMEEFFNDTGINSRYDLPQDIPAFRLSSEQRYNIFLAIKEGLNNIVKYSEATLIAFRLKVEKESFIIEIEDNGKGFDLEQISACGNGLKNMQERISKIGENIEIISRQGLGTTIKIKVCTIECD